MGITCFTAPTQCFQVFYMCTFQRCCARFRDVVHVSQQFSEMLYIFIEVVYNMCIYICVYAVCMYVMYCTVVLCCVVLCCVMLCYVMLCMYIYSGCGGGRGLGVGGVGGGEHETRDHMAHINNICIYNIYTCWDFRSFSAPAVAVKSPSPSIRAPRLCSPLRPWWIF